MNNTSKLVSDKGKISAEQYGKFSSDVADEMKKNQAQKDLERENYISSIPKGLSKEDLDIRYADIETKLNILFPSKNALPAREIGKNGTIVSEHKNKLAFIFIGDVKKAEEFEQYELNAPKISMVIGGGLETTYNPSTGEIIKIDPREDSILGISAQFHLISMADIDVKGILPITTLKNRSAVRAEADIIEMSANEAVFVRSLGRPYNSSGSRIMTPGGVHIISGQNTDKKNIKEPEPMVLGKGLVDTLFQLVEKISEINSTMMSMNEDILQLKASLITHTHIATTLGALTTPSADLVASVAPTMASKTTLNITNGYANLINLEMLKTNNLTALSPNTFLSAFNRVN